MPRNITVTFSDGTSHVYQNAPDDVTPEQVSARASKDFGKPVKALDGGRQPKKTIADRAAPEGRFRTMVREGADAAIPGISEHLVAARNMLFHGGSYADNLAKERAIEAADSRAHPKTAIGSSIAGALVSPIGELKGAGGAVYGGLEGLANSSGNALQRLRQTAVGAAEGYVGGLVGKGVAKAGGKAVSMVASKIKDTNALKRIAGTLGVAPEALKRVAQRIEQDRVAGGPTAEDIRSEMAKDKGKPTALIDYAGENLKGFAGRVARSPGPARQIMAKALNERDKEAGLRIAGDIRRSISSGNADATTQGLIARRAVNAKPLYEEAYKRPPIQPDLMKPNGAIGALLNRPSMKRGLANAYRIASEEGVNPHTLGIDLDSQGEPILSKVPTWKTLDYMKRGIDDVVEAYRDKTTGKLMLDTYGRAAEQTRSQYRSIVTTLNPAYGKALAAYSGPSQSIEAVRTGERALNMASPEELTRRFSELGENDREFFKMGVANSLLKQILKTSSGGDESKRLTGKEWTGMMIRPLFKDQASFDKFIGSVNTEARMFETRQHVLGNSPTARRVAEDGSEANQEAAKYAGRAMLHAVGHNPLGAAGNALKAFQSSRAARDPAVNADIARILTLPPDKAAQAIRLLSRKPLPPKTRNALAVIMGRAAHAQTLGSSIGVNALSQLDNGSP